MAKKKGGIPGLSFSVKRATRISSAKSKIARKTGIPTTKSGRQRKLGAAMGGCVMYILAGIVLIAAFVIL